MSKVSVQIAVLLLGGQIALGAIGLALSGSMPWLGLLLSILLFWLIVRTARVLRREMELAVARKAQVTPWVQALSVVLTWLWPAALLLPGWPFMPQWAPDLWNGSLQPVVGTVALWNSGVAAVMDQWLWLMVPVEGLLYLAVAGRPLTRWQAPVQAVKPRDEVAVGGQWAPARRHKDVMRRVSTAKK